MLRGFELGFVGGWIVESILTGGDFGLHVGGLFGALIGGVLTSFGALFLLVLIDPGETCHDVPAETGDRPPDSN